MKKLTISVVSLVIAVLVGGLIFVSSVDAGGRPLKAELSGANEVPPSGSTASGSAHLTLNQGQKRICFDIDLTGLDLDEMVADVTGAHIHEGVAGTNGGVVVNLSSGINSDEDISGCVSSTKAQIKEIRKNPGSYYINIHTLAVPSGEIRGQLSKK